MYVFTYVISIYFSNNINIFNSYICYNREIEGKVVEVGRLQEILSEKVLQQVQKIYFYFCANLKSNYDLRINVICNYICDLCLSFSIFCFHLNVLIIERSNIQILVFFTCT